MFCRKCGMMIPDDSVFCSKCGEKVVVEQSSNTNHEYRNKTNNKNGKNDKTDQKSWKNIMMTVLSIIGFIIVGGVGKALGKELYRNTAFDGRLVFIALVVSAVAMFGYRLLKRKRDSINIELVYTEHGNNVSSVERKAVNSNSENYKRDYIYYDNNNRRVYDRENKQANKQKSKLCVHQQDTSARKFKAGCLSIFAIIGIAVVTLIIYGIYND